MRLILAGLALLLAVGEPGLAREALAKKDKVVREVEREWDDGGERVIVKERWVEGEQGGPPPHAPAWGRRARHAYRYYPDHEVYYDPGRRLYHYRERETWRSTVTLPPLFGVGLGVSVSLETEREEPWIHEHEVVYKKYPPGQLKKMHKHKHKHKHRHDDR